MLSNLGHVQTAHPTTTSLDAYDFQDTVWPIFLHRTQNHSVIRSKTSQTSIPKLSHFTQAVIVANAIFTAHSTVYSVSGRGQPGNRGSLTNSSISITPIKY